MGWLTLIYPKSTMESLFLSTYQLRARYKRAEGFTMMGQFNGANDLFPLLVEFLTEIFETPVQVGNDEEQNTTLNLTLSEPPIVLENERVVYGYFDAGVSGQEIFVKNRHSKAVVFRGDRDNHSLNRDIFFYFKLPYRSTAGYIIGSGKIAADDLLLLHDNRNSPLQLLSLRQYQSA